MSIDTIINGITEIDAQLAALDAELQPPRAAQTRAFDLTAAATAQLAETTATRKTSIVDFLMGSAGRATVDAIAADTKRNKDAAEKARIEAELASLGAQEVEAMMVPIAERAAPLHQQRDLLVRRAIRALAEDAAEEYVQAQRLAAEKFALVEAHAEILRGLERTEAFDPAPVFGERLSFGPPLQMRQMRDQWLAPVWPELKAFAGAVVTTVLIPFKSDMVGPQNARFAVDFDTVLADLRRSLFARGLR